ncbi:hypothetical protein LIER_33693 [Lithospermum erythrorhizon]|uniref:Retrovirus-related Pol polyprotein from transposon TNT 1-94 n=1 Tax=Lithospermum erythrorhizon TaxID=34254 RepID=A0AAV3S0N5_LITER
MDIETMKEIPYVSVVGSLMYAMICTRPDIASSVGIVSRFLARLGKKHCERVKWILRYFKGTLETSICFGDGENILKSYTDADMAFDIDSKRSTSHISSHLQGKQSRGNLSFKNVWHFPQPRQNT